LYIERGDVVREPALRRDSPSDAACRPRSSQIDLNHDVGLRHALTGENRAVANVALV
jgi:hypothetical protein